MVYTLTLNPALDYYLRIDEISDDIQKASRTSYAFGGKGINVSVILTRLGIENKAVGFLGGFSGDKIRSLVDDELKNADFLSIEGETRINVKLTGAKEITINAPGPVITLKDEQRLMRTLAEIKDSDWLVLSGSIPSSMGDSAYERILDFLRDRNINIVVDTTGKGLLNILRFKPFLIKPNEFELSELAGRKLKSRNDFIKAAKELQALGAQNILISLGKGGMLLVDSKGNVSHQGIIDGAVRNTTGCGDSTVAGFIAGYMEKGSYNYALKLANACANATAFSDGLATAEEIKKLM